MPLDHDDASERVEVIPASADEVADFIMEALRNIEFPPLSGHDILDIQNALTAFARKRALFPIPIDPSDEQVEQDFRAALKRVAGPLPYENDVVTVAQAVRAALTSGDEHAAS